MYPLALEAVGSGPPVLLIHGTAPSLWGGLVAALSADHRVLRYDRRSFGGTGAEPPGRLTAHAGDAAALLRAHAKAPAVVVGWSIGGVIALELAACAPELVAGVVALDPPLHIKRHPRPAMVSAIARARILAAAGRDASGARAFLRWALSRRSGGSDLDRLPMEWRERVARDARAVVGELGAGTGEHLDADALRAVVAPALVLAAQDGSPVFEAAAQRAAAALPRAELRPVPASGHAIQVDAPSTVAAAVRELSGARAGAAAG